MVESSSKIERLLHNAGRTDTGVSGGFSPMDRDHLFSRYQELRRYVGWEDGDAERVASLLPIIEPFFFELVEDFYTTIERHPQANRVMTGGAEQTQRLKSTLRNWLRELFSGIYNADYVCRRWKIGHRHVEIGLDQVYTNAAIARLRRKMLDILIREWTQDVQELIRSTRILSTLIDLDLALIEDAYQTEYTSRKQATERLALIGQVAGGIAHELRNPLNVIKTSVFYLLNVQDAPAEKVSQHLQRIERQVGLADEVILSLSNFARMSLPKREPFRIDDQLHGVIGEVEPPRNIEVTIQCPQDLPQVLADAGQIRIVLGNLLRNAIEAMPNGGQLSLSVERGDRYLDISVKDTGTGIAPEHVERIMEPFFSTKARGIGLGLALAKAIVERNEGLILVESVPGRGCTFTVRLRSAADFPEVVASQG